MPSTAIEGAGRLNHTEDGTMTRGRAWASVAAVLILAAAAADAEAQRRDPPAGGTVGVSFLAADPRGDMGALVDQGFGGQAYGTWPLDHDGRVRIRGDLGFVVYGHERHRSCFAVPVGCRIEMDLSTTNSIFFGGLGPELVLAAGPVQPYLNASFGFSYFATTSSLSGADEWGEDWANTTNFDDGSFAWRAGGGLRVALTHGRKPVSLDLAVERHDNGVVEYLTEGDIVDHPDGSITLHPTRSEADLLTFRVGVSIGIPRGDDGVRSSRRRRR